MRSAVLITGASSGIGAVFAKELAKKNKNLVLIARNDEKLQEIAQNLKSKYQVEINIITQDLTEHDAVKKIFNQLKSEEIDIDFLINNAGVGEYGSFDRTSWQTQQKMIQLNIMALVELTHKYLPLMIDKGYGKIINVSSIAAFQPMPYSSVYAATKAFVLNFTEALWAENKNTGVKILALCPGVTKTEFYEVAGWQRFNINSSEYNNGDDPLEVVTKALQAIDIEEQSFVVPGNFLNQIVTNIPRFFPREIIARLAEREFRPK